MADVKSIIAQRVAKELKGPLVVNLGVGIPTLVSQYLEDPEIYIHTENGMLGVGPHDDNNINPNIVNAGKVSVTETPGTSYFDSVASFAMIRGSHIDVSILGLLQVDQTGLIANWTVPGQNIIGVGGAMDLVEGAGMVIGTMTHCTKTGESKVLRECTYPLTSLRRIDLLVTDLAVFRFREGKMYLVDLMDGVSLETVREKTEAEFIVQLSE